MFELQHAAFSGGKRNQAIVEALASDGLEGRRTLGIRVAQAIYKVDGFKGFYRLVSTATIAPPHFLQMKIVERRRRIVTKMWKYLQHNPIDLDAQYYEIDK